MVLVAEPTGLEKRKPRIPNPTSPSPSENADEDDPVMDGWMDGGLPCCESLC
jgi:hypothetical protein